jgi:hypothetical protein
MVADRPEKPVKSRRSPAQRKNDEMKHLEAVTERTTNAIELRKAGLTFRQIADELGYNDPSSAHQAVQRGLKEILLDVGAEDVVNLELARLDEMTVQCFAIFRDEDASYDQKLRAMDRMLLVMDRRAKFLGTDAAEKIDMNVSGTMESRHTVVIEGNSVEYIQALRDARAEVVKAAEAEGLDMGIVDAEVISEESISNLPVPTVVDREMVQRAEQRIESEEVSESDSISTEQDDEGRHNDDKGVLVKITREETDEHPGGGNDEHSESQPEVGVEETDGARTGD